MPLSNGYGRGLEQAAQLGRGTFSTSGAVVVEIRLVDAGFEVCSTAYRETFRNRFKALMAAHALALGEATDHGRAVSISVPAEWGENVVIEPRQP
jgi:hypothetical protein